MLIYYGDIYKSNFLLVNLSVNFDRNILTIYTDGIIIWKKIKKIKQYDDI